MCQAKNMVPFAAVLLTACAMLAQDTRAALEQRLTARYPVTHSTGDEKDILSAGVVLVLKKDRLTMVPISQPVLVPNVYKEGKIEQKGMHWIPGLPKRVFMTTEKMWVTQIEVKEDAVVFDLLSDPIDDVRYKGVLRFPFPKGTVPLFNDVDNAIAEVFGTETLAGAASAPRQVNQRVSASQVQAPPPIAPPPPPPDAGAAPPKSISVGQSPDQVVAILGQPQKILKPTSSKQIYVYPDMKVIFVGNKVSDVQ